MGLLFLLFSFLSFLRISERTYLNLIDRNESTTTRMTLLCTEVELVLLCLWILRQLMADVICEAGTESDCWCHHHPQSILL